MTERPHLESNPFVLGHIPNLNGYSCEMIFVDQNGNILMQGDLRLNGFTQFINDLIVKETSNDGKTLVLSSLQKKGPVIIYTESVKPTVVIDGITRYQAFELGTQVDFWFKEPLITEMRPTGKVLVRDEVEFPEIKPVFRDEVDGLRVVARRLPISSLGNLTV